MVVGPRAQQLGGTTVGSRGTRLTSRVSLGSPGPQPPATVRSRLSGHVGQLWRLAAIAWVPFGSERGGGHVLRPHKHAGGTGLVGWSDRGGVQPGIEPSVDAGFNHLHRHRQRCTFNVPHLCNIDANVTLVRRETCFREGGVARPKGAASSGARVWTLSTALAEPIRITLSRRPWRARCPPGRRHVRHYRRERSDAFRCAAEGQREWRRTQRLSRERQNRH